LPASADSTSQKSVVRSSGSYGERNAPGKRLGGLPGPFGKVLEEVTKKRGRKGKGRHEGLGNALTSALPVNLEEGKPAEYNIEESRYPDGEQKNYKGKETSEEKKVRQQHSSKTTKTQGAL